MSVEKEKKGCAKRMYSATTTTSSGEGGGGLIGTNRDEIRPALGDS